MVTKVGIQSDFSSALKDLLELDYDAIEAYDAAINRLNNAEYKIKLNEFKSDHERHTHEISAILNLHNEKFTQGPSAKQWLAKGKVVLSTLMGDGAILAAMKSNEEDTNDAYERMNARGDIWKEAVGTLENGLKDEKKHKAWIEKVLK